MATYYPETYGYSQSFNDIAAEQTIGGRSYGLALARYNGFDDPNTKPQSPITIPDDWIGPGAVLVGRPPANIPTPLPASQNNMLLYIGIGLAALAVVATVVQK